MKKSILVSLLGLLIGSHAVAQQTEPTQAPPQRKTPTITPDGVVHVPAFDLPPSALMSPEAAQRLKAKAGTPRVAFGDGSLEQMRAGTEKMLAPAVAAANKLYPVNITEQRIGGVRTRVVMPASGETDPKRVLMNLHGGGFMMCAEGCAMIESIPIAAIGHFKVVTVDYRQGPENIFPAASEDVASVYRELLKSYRPENIGIYGCSAGGSLTAQAVAWFQTHNLPAPGAIGIFGAGAMRFGAGDSAYFSAYVDGAFAAPEYAAPLPYFRGANLDDPLISPALKPEILAHFPPTLLITGTRAPDLSPVVYTHSQLLKAGIRSQLVVGEGLGHCYFYDPGLPESRDAYAAIARHFDENLGKTHRQGKH